MKKWDEKEIKRATAQRLKQNTQSVERKSERWCVWREYVACMCECVQTHANAHEGRSKTGREEHQQRRRGRRPKTKHENRSETSPRATKKIGTNKKSEDEALAGQDEDETARREWVRVYG